MADIVECEIGLAMNETGGWIVCKWSDSHPFGLLSEEEGGDVARVIKIKVKMTPPVATEVLVNIPDEAGETITATAE